MKNLLLTKLFILLLAQSLTASYLTVSDPKQTWKYGQGKIEESTISLLPKGIYTEVSMYLTFSANATSYNSQYDTLEIDYNFDLPEGSLVTDSWLWVEGEIIKADIIDRWTATQIYEGIVKRRRDPSILVKNGSNNYDLKIFPLVGNQTRKVKITYLVLNQWSADGTFFVNLPLNILKSNSYYCYYCGDLFPSQSGLIIRDSDFANFQKTTAANNYTFIDSKDKIGFYKGANISSTDFTSDFKVNFKSSKIRNGIFLNIFPTGIDEGFYQLTVFPNIALDLPIKRKSVFLIDFDPQKTTLTSLQVYEGLKQFIAENYTQKDSLALFFAGFSITGTGDNWIRGDSLSVANAFRALGENPIKAYSNLTPLLTKGADFLNQKGAGDLIVISASEHGFAPGTSNSLINDFVSTIKKGRVFAIDLNRNPQYYYFSEGVNLYGDGYFYSSVSRLTKGIYYSVFDYNYIDAPKTYRDMLTKAVSASSGTLTSFDLHTALFNGFCSGRINVNNSEQTNFSSPVTQVGKYNGTLPLSIQLSGLYNGKPFSKYFFLQENEISKPDSITKTIWAGRYIIDREKEFQSNPIISDIIDISLNNRVLSKYTAFLALEPAQNGKVCSTCVDESISPTGLSEEQLVADSVNISIYPMPVTSEAKITIKDYLSADNSTLKMFNSLGEVVKEFDLKSVASSRGKIELTLNLDEGSPEYPNGTYFLQYYNGSRSKKGKLVIQR
jgi:hypothetical protein